MNNQCNNQIKHPVLKKLLLLKQFVKNHFFFDITIGIIMTSGGMGKKELSINDSKARKGLAYLCPAHSTHLSYNFFIILN